MAFLTDLPQGTHGVRIDFPFSMRIDQDIEREALLRDEARSVAWLVALDFAMVDLSEEHVGLLMGDLEREARCGFEDSFRARHLEVVVPPRAPRTNDPEWSPIVSVEHATVCGARSLVVIHRLAYEPGDETVAGRVVIPLEKGTLFLSALGQASFTGFRETLVTDRVLKERLVDPEHAARDRPISQAEAQEQARQLLPSQAQIDDPALDSVLPEHPLSLVRAALRWLLSGGLPIEVNAPLQSHPGSTVELDRVGCDVTPPPRYIFAPMTAERMSPTLAPFSRACLPGVPHQGFDVWQVPGVRVQGIARRLRLQRLATKIISGWASEGATDIHIDTWVLPPLEKRPRVGSYVRFRTIAGPVHSVACWIADLDGAVFRLAADGPLEVSKDDLARRIETAASTWRRRTR